MKRIALLLTFVFIIGLSGCGQDHSSVDIVATTKPVYDFTVFLCEDTGLQVQLLISDSVSCLHDYSLSTTQMRHLERAEVTVISGAGLESFADDVLKDRSTVIDSSAGISLLESCHAHADDHSGHHHETDSHIWLSPVNAKIMCENICQGLSDQFPQHRAVFEKNLAALLTKLDDLQAYGESQLSSLSCRKLITFHDGFAYLADAFDLELLAAIEEEDGSTISAEKRIELTQMIKSYQIPALFTEINGFADSAQSIAGQTGIAVFALDTAMSETDYFGAMLHNIYTLKEALG